MEKNSIPENWARAKIKDISDKIHYGYTASSKKENTGVKYLRITDIQNNSVNWSDVPYCKIPTDDIEKYVLYENDLVFARTGGTVGKSFRIKSDVPKAVFASYLIRIIPSKYFVPQYLELFFNSIDYWSQIKLNKTGLKTNVNARILGNIELSIPPFNEQKRIVRKIEKLMPVIKTNSHIIDDLIDSLEILKLSILKITFLGNLTKNWRENNKNKIQKESDHLSNLKGDGVKVRRDVPKHVELPDSLNVKMPESWSLVSFAQMLRKNFLFDLKDGNHGANHPKKSDFTSKGLPFITASQVNNNKIDYKTAPKLSGKPLEKLHVGFAKSGDVIFTHKATIGRIGICDQDCIMSPQTTYYRANPKIVDNFYLAYFFSSPFFKKQVNNVKSQTTRDFVSITKQYQFFMIFPTLSEQQEIVKSLNSKILEINKVRSQLEILKVKNNLMKISILKLAFQGNLVAQDFNDESATDLLEKIKSDKKRKLKDD